MYDTRNDISLAAVITDGANGSPLVDPGRPIGAVTILRISAGGQLFLRVGNAQRVRISSPGVFTGFDPLHEGKQGLYLSNDVAQAGVTFDIMIGYLSDADVARLTAFNT